MTGVAREIARDHPGIIVFQVSEEMVASASPEWSLPVRFRFEQAEDGTYELILRTVTDLGPVLQRLVNAVDPYGLDMEYTPFDAHTEFAAAIFAAKELLSALDGAG